MKPAVMIAALLIAGAPSAPTAAQRGDGFRTGRCSLMVDGRSYMSGTCSYRWLGGGGFQMSKRVRGGSYFVYLNPDGHGGAEATWNGSPDGTRAHDPLGQLRRQGACWVNDHARVCLWASRR